MWSVLYLPRAEKALRKLDRQIARRVMAGLDRLAELDDPTTACTALSGPLVGAWRYRVGDYRVIVDVDHGNLAIVAVDLGHRSDIYS